MISKDGIHALEQFVLAKYYITNQVYRHRVRLITDQMLIRAINIGIDSDNIEELHKLYTYQPNQKYIEEYLGWDDLRLMVTYTDNRFKGKGCHELLSRLNSRNLLKRIYQKQLKDLPETCRDPLLGISKPIHKKLRSELEVFLWEPVCHLVADKGKCELTCSPDNSSFLIINGYTIKSVREMSRNDEASIPVDKGLEKPSTFEEESTLFKSINEKLNHAFVEIYAPVSYDTPVDRTKLQKKVDQIITEKIDAFFKGGGHGTT